MQNFGQINETFKNILVDSIITKDTKGKKIFKAYVKTLKENKVLKIQYDIYQKLENKINSNNDESSSMFVDECISILQKIGNNKITEINNKLIKFLNKNGYNVYADDYEFKELHEHINNLAFSERNTKNINSIIESKLFIKKHSKIYEEKKEIKIVEPYSNKILLPLMKNKFNEKYSNLTELEKKVIRLSINGNEEEKKELYTNTVKECVDLVNEQLKECSIDQKDTLLQVKDKLLRYNFNSDNFASEMSEMNYLKTTLN